MSAAWADAMLAARILAVDAAAIGGVRLHAGHGPVREAWLERVRSLLPPQVPMRRVPAQIAEERLIGGLDLTATLARGRPVLQRGVLAECHQGLILLPMAERLERGIAARIAATLDSGEVRIERDGFSSREPAAVGIVLIDESAEDDPGVPPVLRDRVAIWLDLRAVRLNDIQCQMHEVVTLSSARGALASVRCGQEAVTALCTVAAAVGLESLRVPFMALQVARIVAALEGQAEVGADELRTAARLVISPRAVQLPAEDRAVEQRPSEESPAPSAESAGEADRARAQELADQVLAAARSAIPADLLARLAAAGESAPAIAGAGRAGMLKTSLRRGRPAGVRKGIPRPGIRLSVIDTLRAAAPWQRLRRREAAPARRSRLQLRAEDFHVRRFRQRSDTVTVFVVDASGSAAMHRLAEAKGAVELLLAQCYVRRDRVAVIAFRNKTAEVLLPPTRSLLRARRSMAGLVGGGGTPLAAGIHAATQLAQSAQRTGLSPTLVFLTDGRGNLTLAGVGDRDTAEREALAAARTLRLSCQRSILIDTSPRPAAAGSALAKAMGGLYLPLPYADSARMAQAVQRLGAAAD